MRARRLSERSEARLVRRIARVGERVAVELMAAIEAAWPVAPPRLATVPAAVSGPPSHHRRTV
jgi:hypothetical protein